jgi:tetratricopeptide (TPR) repeat protein
LAPPALERKSQPQDTPEGKETVSERDIFIAAVQLADCATRAAFVEQACGGDTALRGRVEALLQAHDQAGSFLSLPATQDDSGPARAGAALPSEVAGVGSAPGGETCGTVVGRYKLLQQLGEGGMGTVFLAEQTEPIQRLVALKIIKAGLDSRHVLSRFEQERQALALMDHPHIAKVLDGGSTADGKPYFVMELVKGIPITKFCDQEHLSLHERLALFVPVCQAVQHAHQKGIIHRDLKPSNVLIGLYDGKPIPKVIDFGVAKATARKLTERTLFTEVGRIIGTLEYMAPEQAELNNLDIDTRADVYSLGVLLYELLTGSPPFTGKQLRSAAFDDMLRMIREVEPPKPSTKLSGSEELPNIAARRKLEPKKLARQVQGELDWIAMKCLEKDRSRRYETANGLALDVQRFLAGEPVLAGRPSKGYRLRRFLRRHRGPVLAAAALLLFLVVGVIGTTIGLFRAHEAETDARAQTLTAEQALKKEEAQRKKAEQATIEERKANLVADERRQHAEAAASLLESVFQGLDPRAEHLAGWNVREQLLARLDEAAALLEREALDPLTQVRLQNALGQALLGLGETGPAISHFERSLKKLQARLGPDHADTLATTGNLALAQHLAGRLDLALPLFVQTLAKQRAELGPNHAATLTTMNNLAGAYESAGQLDLALPLYEQTLELMKVKLGPDHLTTLTTMDNLANAYEQAGKLEAAVSLYKTVLEKRKARLGPDHPGTLITAGKLGGAYQDLGRLDLALPLIEETREQLQAKLGPDHPATLIGVQRLADAYRAAGKVHLALPLLEQTLAKQKARLGPDHPHTLATVTKLAGVHHAAGRLDLALPLYEQALKQQKAKLGDNHGDTIGTMNNLAVAYQAAGQFDLALPLFEQTVAKCKARWGADHPNTLLNVYNLAFVYQAVGRLGAALPLFEATLAKQQSTLGLDHPQTLTTMNSLARAYQAADKVHLAVPLFEATLAKRQAKLGPDHHDTLVTMDNLAGAYFAAGKPDRAIPLFEQALEKMKAHLGLDHPDTLLTMHNLGTVYRHSGEFKLALPLLEQALDKMKAKLGPDHHDTLITMNTLAVTYWSARKLERSVPLFEELLRVQKKKLGPDHATTVLTMANLAVNYRDAGRLAEAIPLFEQAVEMVLKRPGPLPPQFAWIPPALAAAYDDSGQFARAEPLYQRALEEAKKKFSADDVRVTAPLAQLALNLLQQQKFAEAEPLLRDCLKIREQKQADAWMTFNTQSMLGGSLLGQKKYGEAERLLLAGYAGMKQREPKIPPRGKIRLREAARYLVELYEALGDPEQADAWRQRELARQRRVPPPVTDDKS